VNNYLHTISRRQRTRYDLVMFFDKFCLQRSLFTKKSCLQRLFFTKILSMDHFISVTTFSLPIHWTQAHMYNQITRGMETTRHRSLGERGGRNALLETLQTQKKNQKKTNIHESKKKIRAHRASRKATRLFLTKK